MVTPPQKTSIPITAQAPTCPQECQVFYSISHTHTHKTHLSNYSPIIPRPTPPRGTNDKGANTNLFTQSSYYQSVIQLLCKLMFPVPRESWNLSIITEQQVFVTRFITRFLKMCMCSKKTKHQVPRDRSGRGPLAFISSRLNGSFSGLIL